MDFNTFFRSERDSLLRMCWLLTLDREAAADVAQEAMTRAWSNWDTLSQPESNPPGWVRVVATNLARSRWRRLSGAARALRPLHEPAESPPVSDPGLLDAMRELSSRQREVVLLRYWADLKLRDCAETMGVSLGSAKQHLARAHARLEVLIGEAALEELTL